MAWWKIGAFVGFVTAAVLRRLLRNSRLCPSKTQMNGKTVIITGANCGIGKATALELARRNARIILACRNLASAAETAKQICRSTGNTEIIPRALDLSSIKSIREFSQEILSEEHRIDVLVNNAGVFQCPYSKTEDGFEMQMGVNHFGHFLLTSLLTERLKQSAPSRIVIVSSALSKRGSINFDDIHSEKSYNKMKAYADSKLANLMFTKELSKRLDGSGVSVLALHPGMVATDIARHVVSRVTAKLFSPIVVALGLRDASEGCQPVVYCASAEELKGCSGVYISKLCKECEFPSSACDEEQAKKLWDISEQLTKTKFP
ncbi:retinol dehydrogenase 14 [Aplysia californica]|uniref:Retinol dehydrogenase 14 n=1 Tax=Aplysia californica TaxID=6500 RepID=A0ABM0JM98_APLCA|nr:retinol dehydrogenase 14 [Aplysia californica]